MPLRDVSSPQETEFFGEIEQSFLQEAQGLARADYLFNLEASSYKKIEESWKNFQAHLKSNKKIYGTHTHFGAQISRECKTSHAEHQKELIRYLQVGVGSFFKEGVVRRALRLQVKKMALGLSGVSPQTMAALIAYSNSQEIAPVPQDGSLGASGDLIPMAHALGPLFEQIEPGARDALALVNTNSMVVSHAIDLFLESRKLILNSLSITVKILLATQTSQEMLTLFEIDEIKEQRPRCAQVALWMKKQIHGRQESETKPQEAQGQPRYSLRCSPLVFGLALDLLEEVQKKIELEYRSLADNPVITQEAIYHGGLFYTVYLASASDQLMEAIARVAEMLDRQVLLLMDPELSSGLSYNLEYPGLSHCKGIHQLISSLYQRLRSFGVPSWQMSFSAESNNQDIVPASMQAWNRIQDMLGSFRSLVKAADFCATRALAIRGGQIPASLESWSQSQSH